MKSGPILFLSLCAFAISSLAFYVALAPRIDAESARHDPESYELAPAMSDLQRFTEKLYHAGRNENWALADFYLHEIEETTAEIVKREVVDEGVQISELMRSFMPHGVEQLEAVVKAEDAEEFLPRYEALVNACNSCHEASGYSFLKITTPSGPAHWNQVFTPEP